MRDLTS